MTPVPRRLRGLAAIGAVLLTTTAVTAAALTIPASAHPAAGRPELTITTVSNPHPDLVSGDEVLVRVTGAGDGPLRLTDDGGPAGGPARQQDGSWLALVKGLRPGTNHLVAASGDRKARLTVVDHPISGPVFSGQQQLPFYCETTAFGLAPSSQPRCSAPTVVSYQYRTTAGTFVPLADPGARPADLATATVAGHQVPYIIRVETGTIDRAVYQTAALYDGTAPSPLRPDTSWNDRLVYTFGGGCDGGHHQGDATGGVLNDLFLSQGYAVASASLNVLDINCSTIISAEAAMMVKEHFVDTYGPVAHTIGWGGSGGAMQQQNIADAYPGILDGIVPAISFPDPFSLMPDVADCRLLDRFFAGSAVSFTPAQKQAVSGFRSYDSCTTADTYFANRLTATDSCNKDLLEQDNVIPQAAIWNPVTNPDGVKCSALESYADQFGRDPATGFVRSVVDNVGVQYGLTELEHGQISPAQFAALNAGIGGYDTVGAAVARRSQADPAAVAAAYRDDVVTAAGLGLRTTPIIDQRQDMDLAGPLWDVHTTQWSFALRSRLLAANGTAANQVIIETGLSPAETAAANAYELSAMDQWLTDIEADHSARDRQAKVIADKPAGLGDGCYLSATDRVQSPLTDPATGPCAAAYPVASDPRQQAGAPQGENVLKCTLRPLDFAAYPVTFTGAEQALLRKAFPTGVCDYTKPGIGQTQQPRTWREYGLE
jgi:hypothetical protein